MDRDTIEKELQKSKIREGPLLKRSRFLKEWRERWVVLTFNYILTFTNKTYKEVTDVMDLRTVKSYKSYVSKSEEMIPASFKIRSGDSALYMCAKSTEEKWSWIVTVQRLLDYRESGANNYNNLSYIKSKGFPSLDEFNNPNLDMGNQMANYKALLKTAEMKKDELQKQSIELAKKMFLEQQQLQREKDQIRKQKARIQILKDEIKLIKSENQKRQSLRSSQTFFSVSSGVNEQNSYQSTERQSNVKKLSNLYENKAIEHNKIKKQFLVSKQNIINGIFDELYPESEEYFGFKYYVDFLIYIASDSRLGFHQPIMNACQNHHNNKHFMQIFVEILEDYQPTPNPRLSTAVKSSFSLPSQPNQLEYLSNLLNLLNMLLCPNLIPLLSTHQQELIANKTKQLLLTDESNSSEELQLLLSIVKKLKKFFHRHEMQERLIKAHKLSKKENISVLAKQVLNSLE